ncbi:MAG: sporulation protein YqfD [Oscillospiraceae bacterium]|nr:sporulation protein YqfD [Oscillospiraceae bacterium]
MLKNAVFLLRGGVRVRTRGDFPERVLNVCAARGIAFRDPAFLDENELALTVEKRDWRRLKDACADIGASAHIERVSGAPFLLGRLKRRRALLLGLALCAALLLVNACFIWELRVEGNETVSADKILRVLSENGVRRGTFAFSIHQRKLCNRALLRLPELVWLTVNVRGCRATVVVRERIPRPEIVNESVPTNVIARRDGMVTDMRVLDGEARVLPGTVVRRGQLLISGVVDTKGVEQPVVGTRYLAGKGEVYARTWYELSTRIPLFREVKSLTGAETRTAAVSWGENRVKFPINGAGNLPGEYDKIISRKQWTLPGGLILPVAWETELIRPYTTVRVSRSREEAREQGSAALDAYLRSRLGASGEVVSERVAAAAQGDWLLVTLSAECREQIGESVPVSARPSD